ncbi:MAG: ATP phosphoribosyltransferase regulatory subunit, partial [Roseiarcus sp.]
KDESGDFTRGVGLSLIVIDRVIGFMDSKAQGAIRLSEIRESLRADMLSADAPDLSLGRAEIEPAAVDNQNTLNHWLNTVGLGPSGDDSWYTELTEFVSCCYAAGYGTRRIRIDPSVVRGLEYYTGPVFEAELTFETPGEDGKPIRFGSVGGGGRYDGLVARFRGEAVPATGFSIGVSRLLAALRAIQSPIVAASRKPGPVVVVVLDRDRLADYQRLVGRLRAEGIASELYLGAGGLNAQLKYADRRGSLCAVIQGSNERDAAGGPQVVIRDLVLGAQLADKSRDRADHLELRQRAQATVPEAELVARVREVLARHRVDGGA